MGPSNNLESKISSDAYWRVQLVFMKVQAHISSEPPLEYSHFQTHLTRLGMTFLTNLVFTEILFSFRVVLEWKADKKIPVSSKVLRNIFRK